MLCYDALNDCQNILSIYSLCSCGWIVQNTAAQRAAFGKRGKIKKKERRKKGGGK
jgi:hypothetical protein